MVGEFFRLQTAFQIAAERFPIHICFTGELLCILGNVTPTNPILPRYGPSEWGTSSPASDRPFKTANNLEPLVEDFKPISSTASLTPFAKARRAASAPVRYADGIFPVDPFHPILASSLDDAEARTISPRSSASVIWT